MTAPGRILWLRGPSGSPAAAVGGGGVEVADELERVLSAVRDPRRPPHLVVVDLSFPRPMSAARRIRSVDSSVSLAFTAPSTEVEPLRARLALLPEIADAVVVRSDGDTLPPEVRTVASAARRRQQVRAALDTINRDLVGTPRAAAAARAATVSEHYLAALVRHAADTIISLDNRRQVVTINAAGERTLGIAADEAEGRPLEDLLAPDDTGDLLTLLEQAGGGEAQIRDELPVKLADGRQLLLSATAAPILGDDGAVAGSAIIARDVTTERRTEERLRQLQKAESLATLASGVAHDFNNLLVRVQGWASLACDAPDDHELVANALEQIQDATRRAAELARSMLAYGGRGRFEVEDVPLNELVTDLRQLLASSVPAKVDLRLELAAGQGPTIRSDPTQVRQVLVNLVINAGEALGDEPGTIHIRTGTDTVDATRAEEPHDVLLPGTYGVLEVTDTGPGIDPDIQDRLFDPFFTTKFAGRGLGLAASHGIVSAHGGAIIVDSQPGAGACFRVLLPAVEPEDLQGATVD